MAPAPQQRSSEHPSTARTGAARPPRSAHQSLPRLLGGYANILSQISERVWRQGIAGLPSAITRYGIRDRWPSVALCTLAWSTTATIVAAPRHNRLTKGKLPRANSTPPREAPPTAPNWLLTVKRPVAVAHDGPACSVSSTAVTGHDKSNRLATPKATITVAHGEMAVVKTRAAPSPPPRPAPATAVTR